MHPNASFYDGPDQQGLEQQARLDRQREEESAFQERYESERQDRAVIREELRRGVPEAEIEERLELASDFVRLNPGQDVRAYVRGLIDEEKSSFHALSDVSEPFREGLTRAAKSNGEQRPEQPRSAAPPLPEQPPQEEMRGAPAKPSSPPAPNPKTAEAEAMAREYVNGSFNPDDWLAVLAVNRNSGETMQRISPTRNIASPEYQRWLRYLNATGSDVYVSLNTFKEHARGRTKEDLKEIRHLYLDLDKDAARKLEAIRQDNAVPAPNYVLNTSPGKFQVIWRVEGIDQDQAEAMLRTLAQRFGGDPAATDSTRVFRLPGFNNKKYPENFQVTVSREAAAAEAYRAEDFKVYGRESERVDRMPGSPDQEHALSREQYTQSERDWQYAIRRLKAGEDPNQIIRDMASYRSKDRFDKNDPTKLVAPAKARPYYYAEQTVTKAMASLGMTKQPARTAKAAASSRESETAPSR
ncbi:MAG: DNA-primase RepB domain-containing protein [Terriglobia bacterium]